MTFLPMYSTSLFTWIPEDKTYVAEASTLAGVGYLFGQVYPDACDEGFAIFSEKLNKVLTFAVWFTEEKDGDTLFWDLVPIQETERKVPESRGVRIRVYND